MPLPETSVALQFLATILAGEHARQGLREMLLKTPERGAVPELIYIDILR